MSIPLVLRALVLARNAALTNAAWQAFISRTDPPTVGGRRKDNNMNILSGYDDDDDFGAVGADEDLLEALSISGDGTSEIVGADIIGAMKQSKAGRSALNKIKMRHAAAVVNNPLSKKRRYPLGFVPTTVDASTGGISVPGAPQNLFRPERFVVPSDIAFDLGVQDLKVGNTSQFVQNVEVPAAIFTEVAMDTFVAFDTAEIGNQISATLRNKTASDVEFSAAAIGTIAK